MPYYHCLHNNQPGHDKIYVVMINRLIDKNDKSPTYQVMACWGRATAKKLTSQCKGEYSKMDEANTAMDDLVQKHLWDGYQNVAAYGYVGSLCLADILAKVDTSRMLPTNAIPHGPAPMPKKPLTKPSATRPVRSVRM